MMAQQLNKITGWRARLRSIGVAAPAQWRAANSSVRPPCRGGGVACASTTAANSGGGAASSSDDDSNLGCSGSGPILKQVVATQMSDALYAYLLQHTREHQASRCGRVRLQLLLQC